MALFGKKKQGEGDTETAEASKPEAVEPALSPEKAKRFFEHARTVHEATNYEYAMQSWLRGLRFDPSDMNALEGFFGSAALFLGSGPKAKPSKETLGAIPSKTDVDKWVQSLLAWAMKPADAALAVKSVKLASKNDLGEQAYWLGERALAVLGGEKKVKKEPFVELMESFAAVGAYDLAVRAGEAACRLDPSDSDLEVRVRNISAQSAMSGGGFDDANAEGGFRKNIRNADQQRQLDEADRISKTGSVKDRVLVEAEAAFRERPDDMPTLDKLLKALRERAQPEDEKRAVALATKAFEATGQFKYRQMAGEIEIRWARRKLGQYRDAAAKNPKDEAAQATYAKAQRKFLEMEAKLLKLRAEAYPTDLFVKYELGRRVAALGDHEQAIALFQESKNDAKVRTTSMRMLGQSFAAIGWNDEAVETLRHALTQHEDESNDEGFELRYALMVALLNKAQQDRDPAPAEEADKIASGIAMQQIGYKDIRERRQEIKQLLSELKG